MYIPLPFNTTPQILPPHPSLILSTDKQTVKLPFYLSPKAPRHLCGSPPLPNVHECVRSLSPLQCSRMRAGSPSVRAGRSSREALCDRPYAVEPRPWLTRPAVRGRASLPYRAWRSVRRNACHKGPPDCSFRPLPSLPPHTSRNHIFIQLFSFSPSYAILISKSNFAVLRRVN